MEFRMVHHCCTGRSDFTEGVKALLIEKRGQARWDPASIEQVPPQLSPGPVLDWPKQPASQLGGMLRGYVSCSHGVVVALQVLQPCMARRGEGPEQAMAPCLAVTFLRGTYRLC